MSVQAAADNSPRRPQGGSLEQREGADRGDHGLCPPGLQIQLHHAQLPPGAAHPSQPRRPRLHRPVHLPREVSEQVSTRTSSLLSLKTGHDLFGCCGV